MRLLLLLVCCLFSLGSYAQRLKLGLRTGASFTNFYAHRLQGEIPDVSFQPGQPNGSPIILNPIDYQHTEYFYRTRFISDTRAGFHSYLCLDIYLQQRLSIECALGYNQRGISIDYRQYATLTSDNSTTEQYYQFKRDLRLDYLSLPVTFQYQMGRKKRLYVLGGFYNGYAINFVIKSSLVQLHEKQYNSSGQVITESKASIMDEGASAKMFDAGLIGGLGAHFPVSERITIGMDVRSAIGVVNIPAHYERQGFQSFREESKNISFETGLKIQYSLNR